MEREHIIMEGVGYLENGYKEKGFTNNEQEGYHKDNHGLISMFRHGDKVGEDLSTKGFQQMLDKGTKTEVAGSRVKAFFSPWLRAEQSVETMTSALAAKATHPDFRKKVSRERGNLNFEPFSKEGLKQFKEKGGVGWYYKLGSERPDPDSLSPDELACRAATVLDTQIRMIGRLKDGSGVNLANASHSPTMDVLLIKLLEDEIDKDPINKDGKDILEKIGGSLAVAEGFDVDARTDSDGILSANIKFRGKEYPVNLKKLRGMAEEYQERGYASEEK